MLSILLPQRLIACLSIVFSMKRSGKKTTTKPDALEPSRVLPTALAILTGLSRSYKLTCHSDSQQEYVWMASVANGALVGWMGDTAGEKKQQHELNREATSRPKIIHSVSVDISGLNLGRVEPKQITLSDVCACV